MNIALAFLGWIVWNFGLFSIEKSNAELKGNDFSITHYTKCYWDDWVFSLFFIPVLIICGIKGLGLQPVPALAVDELKWQDSYYFGAGAAAEAFKYFISQVKKKFMS